MHLDYSATRFQHSLTALIKTKPDWVGGCIINTLTVVKKRNFCTC